MYTGCVDEWEHIRCLQGIQFNNYGRYFESFDASYPYSTNTV